jgi:hypothetical protein
MKMEFEFEIWDEKNGRRRRLHTDDVDERYHELEVGEEYPIGYQGTYIKRIAPTSFRPED